MNKFFTYMVVVCLFLCLSLPAWAGQATFEIITDPVVNWSNYAFSADGTVMAANYGGEIYRWTATNGFQYLGPGDSFNSSIGISADGSTIISGRVGTDGFTSPTIWKNGAVVDLGHPKNGCTQLASSWGSGYGVNADGSIAAGLAWNCHGAEGFKWTAKRGVVSLGHPAGHHSSRASAISADGKTSVGFWEDPTGPRRPVRWIGSKHDLFLGETTLGEATAVTSDGQQIAGQVYTDSGSAVAFVYTDQGGLRALGTITHSPFDQSIANGVSDTGRVVGWSGDPFGNGIEAFFWSEKKGMKRLSRVLQSMGAQIPDGMVLTTAIAISADGLTVAGEYMDAQFNFGNWIAHLKK